MNSLILIIFLIIFSLVTFIYSFLPGNIQNIPWVRVIAIFSAIVILAYTSYNFIDKYRSRIIAMISSDGVVTNSNNFPWKILKTTNQGETIYLIEEWHVDPSQISIKMESENIKPSMHAAMDGLAKRLTINQLVYKIYGFTQTVPEGNASCPR